MKSYTDIEQSKKLAEILPIESADMRYGYIAPYEFSDCMYEGGYDEVPYSKDFLIENPNFSPNDYDGEFPCWSLTALLNVLPSASLDSSDDHHFRIHCKKMFSKWYNNPIDACYEILIKIKEEKKSYSMCTTFEQSKKLAELGVDISTADMFWDTAEPDKRRKPIVGPISDYYEMENWAIPAWSLDALLDNVLPKEIDDDFILTLSFDIYSDLWYLYYIDDLTKKTLKTTTGNTIINAAFEMVCWLKENGKI